MAERHAITAPLSADHRMVIDRLAADRGVPTEQVVGEMLASAAEEQAQLLLAIAEGRAEIARGEFLTHEDFLAEIESRKRDRRRAA